MKKSLFNAIRWIFLLVLSLTVAACTTPMLLPLDGMPQPKAAPPEEATIIERLEPTPTCCPSPISFSLPEGTAPVTLIVPVDGALGNGDQRFVWQSNIELPAGTAYELIFWHEGEDPLLLGFGLHQPIAETELTVDLSYLDQRLMKLFEPGDYQWGILLVNVDPYQRRQLLSAPRRFHYAPEPGQVQPSVPLVD